MKEYKCRICKKEIDGSDAYEYRGAIACADCFDEACKQRDFERQEVIEKVQKSVENQRTGEFINNPKKYDIHNVAGDGLPICKIKEPKALEDYEKGD